MLTIKKRGGQGSPKAVKTDFHVCHGAGARTNEAVAPAAKAVKCAWWSALALAVACLVGCTPSGPKALLEGERLLNENRYGDAIAQFKRATTLMTTNAQAWNFLGLACHRGGLPREALEAYRKALDLDKNLGVVRFNLGCLLLEQNRPADAALELASYTVMQPHSREGWLTLGAACCRARRIDDANRAFQEALKLDKKSVEALNGLGIVSMLKSRTRDANAYFANALALQPNYPPAILNYAVLLQQQPATRANALLYFRQYLSLLPPPPHTEAAAAAARALELELAPRPAPPTSSTTPATTNAPAIVSTNAPRPHPQTPVKPVVAATSAPPVIVTGPSNALVAIPPAPKPAAAEKPAAPKLTVPAKPAIQATQVVAQVSEPVKPVKDVVETPKPAKESPEPPKPAKPVTETTKPVAEAPKPAVEAAKPVAEAPKPAKEAVAAVTGMKRYHYLHPAKPAAGDRAKAESAFALAAQAFEQKQLKDAITNYEAAIKHDPTYFDAQFGLGLASLEAGNLPRALSACEQALAIDPQDADARFNFALALQRAGYLQDAVAELEEFVRQNPNDSRVRLLLANLYAQQLNQTTKAREHYQALLKLDPQHPQSVAIRYWLMQNQ